MKRSRMTQIFLTHISTFCSLLPALPPALVYSRYSAQPPHATLPHAPPFNATWEHNKSEQPLRGPVNILLSIRTPFDVTKYPYFLCCVRKGALFSSLTRDSRRRSPLQLYAPARLSRSLLTLNFPKLKSSHISSASSFYFLAEDTRHRHRLSWIRLIGPRSLPSSAYWRSSWLKVGESSGELESFHPL